MRDSEVKFLVAFLKGVWIWGLLAWLYVVSNIYVFPQAQFLPLSLYVPIQTDLVGVLGFVISLPAFILWEWLK